MGLGLGLFHGGTLFGGAWVFYGLEWGNVMAWVLERNSLC